MKRETKFTPGEWGVESPFGEGSLAVVANAEKPTYDWKIIASCFSDEIGEEPNGIPLIEQRANAHLLAAATKMYAALGQAEIAVEQLCVGQHKDNTCWSILAEVRSALAKAQGEQRTD